MKSLILIVALILSLPLISAEKTKGAESQNSIFKSLNLTPEQQSKLKEIRAEKMPMMGEGREEFKDLQTKLHDKLKSDASESEVQALFDELHQKKTERMKEHFSHMLKIRAILTPEQRVKFYDLREKRKMGRKGKGPHGMGMMGAP